MMGTTTKKSMTSVRWYNRAICIGFSIIIRLVDFDLAEHPWRSPNGSLDLNAKSSPLDAFSTSTLMIPIDYWLSVLQRFHKAREQSVSRPRSTPSSSVLHLRKGSVSAWLTKLLLQGNGVQSHKEIALCWHLRLLVNTLNKCQRYQTVQYTTL